MPRALVGRARPLGDRRAYARLRTLAGPGPRALRLTVTFAAIDWVMSLEPHWFSTIYGVIDHRRAGAGRAGLRDPCSACCRATSRSDRGHGRPVPRPRQAAARLRHAVGLRRLLAVPDHLVRQPARGDALVPAPAATATGSWVGLALALLHFALPFVVLLSADLEATPRRLADGRACSCSHAHGRHDLADRPRVPGPRRLGELGPGLGLADHRSVSAGCGSRSSRRGFDGARSCRLADPNLERQPVPRSSCVSRETKPLGAELRAVGRARGRRRDVHRGHGARHGRADGRDGLALRALRSAELASAEAARARDRASRVAGAARTPADPVLQGAPGSRFELEDPARRDGAIRTRGWTRCSAPPGWIDRKASASCASRSSTRRELLLERGSARRCARRRHDVASSLGALVLAASRLRTRGAAARAPEASVSSSGSTSRSRSISTFHDESGASGALGDYFGERPLMLVARLLHVPDAVQPGAARRGARLERRRARDRRRLRGRRRSASIRATRRSRPQRANAACSSATGAAGAARRLAFPHR